MKRQISCEWGEDIDGNWTTGCDEIYIFLHGTPKQNGMKFCCYCGKPLTEQYNNE